ncbi:MAG: (2Fe-2S)-binding protein [Steroidobacteraceae bacterium]
MYVCVCHGISERRIEQALREGVRSFEELQNKTGVGTCCGACEPCARRMVDDRALASDGRSPQAA